MKKCLAYMMLAALTVGMTVSGGYVKAEEKGIEQGSKIDEAAVVETKTSDEAVEGVKPEDTSANDVVQELVDDPSSDAAVKDNGVAMIGDTAYATLKDAIFNVKAGETILLTKDVMDAEGQRLQVIRISRLILMGKRILLLVREQAPAVPKPIVFNC